MVTTLRRQKPQSDVFWGLNIHPRPKPNTVHHNLYIGRDTRLNSLKLNGELAPDFLLRLLPIWTGDELRLRITAERISSFTKEG